MNKKQFQNSQKRTPSQASPKKVSSRSVVQKDKTSYDQQNQLIKDDQFVSQLAQTTADIINRSAPFNQLPMRQTYRQVDAKRLEQENQQLFEANFSLKEQLDTLKKQVQKLEDEARSSYDQRLQQTKQLFDQRIAEQNVVQQLISKNLDLQSKFEGYDAKIKQFQRIQARLNKLQIMLITIVKVLRNPEQRFIQSYQVESQQKTANQVGQMLQEVQELKQRIGQNEAAQYREIVRKTHQFDDLQRELMHQISNFQQLKESGRSLYSGQRNSVLHAEPEEDCQTFQTNAQYERNFGALKQHCAELRGRLADSQKQLSRYIQAAELYDTVKLSAAFGQKERYFQKDHRLAGEIERLRKVVQIQEVQISALRFGHQSAASKWSDSQQSQAEPNSFGDLAQVSQKFETVEFKPLNQIQNQFDLNLPQVEEMQILRQKNNAQEQQILGLKKQILGLKQATVQNLQETQSNQNLIRTLYQQVEDLQSGERQQLTAINKLQQQLRNYANQNYLIRNVAQRTEQVCKKLARTKTELNLLRQIAAKDYDFDKIYLQNQRLNLIYEQMNQIVEGQNMQFAKNISNQVEKYDTIIQQLEESTEQLSAHQSRSVSPLRARLRSGTQGNGSCDQSISANQPRYQQGTDYSSDQALSEIKGVPELPSILVKQLAAAVPKPLNPVKVSLSEPYAIDSQPFATKKTVLELSQSNEKKVSSVGDNQIMKPPESLIPVLNFESLPELQSLKQEFAQFNQLLLPHSRSIYRYTLRIQIFIESLFTDRASHLFRFLTLRGISAIGQSTTLELMVQKQWSAVNQLIVEYIYQEKLEIESDVRLLNGLLNVKQDNHRGNEFLLLIVSLRSYEYRLSEQAAQHYANQPLLIDENIANYIIDEVQNVKPRMYACMVPIQRKDGDILRVAVAYE